MIEKIKSFKKEFKARQKYCNVGRKKFYDLAKKYLPVNEDANILDIGAGVGEFGIYLNLNERYKNFYVLDCNLSTVEKLKKIFNKVLHHKIPDALPIEDSSVDFIHASHLIEHLQPHDLYKFLKDIDRVLKPGGILVISAPLMWERFYNDLSHIKPYNPKVLIKYMCQGNENATSEGVSSSYKIEKLVYRFKTVYDDSWGSNLFLLDSAMKMWRRFLSRIGFKKYIKNGYTIILRK